MKFLYHRNLELHTYILCSYIFMLTIFCVGSVFPDTQISFNNDTLGRTNGRFWIKIIDYSLPYGVEMHPSSNKAMIIAGKSR